MVGGEKQFQHAKNASSLHANAKRERQALLALPPPLAQNGQCSFSNWDEKKKDKVLRIFTMNQMLLANRKKKDKAQLYKVWAHSPIHPLCAWLMDMGLMHMGAGPLRIASHLLGVPLSARELREPSEPW